jgi:hypothetical protein
MPAVRVGVRIANARHSDFPIIGSMKKMHK